jgi:hypothetical protein
VVIEQATLTAAQEAAIGDYPGVVFAAVPEMRKITNSPGGLGAMSTRTIKRPSSMSF